MNTTQIILLSFCLYSAMYYRNATSYLKLIYESDKYNGERLFINPLLDGANYINRSYVKVLRGLALIIMIGSCMLAFEVGDLKGSLIVVIVGVSVAIYRSKSFYVRNAESYINRSNFYLIISAVICISILMNLK